MPCSDIEKPCEANCRKGLSYAFTLLSVNVMYRIVGLSVLLPRFLIVWVVVKVVRRVRKKGQATA